MPGQFDKDGKQMTVAGYIRAGKAGQSLKKAMDGPASFKKGRAGGIKEGLEKGNLDAGSISTTHLSSPERVSEIAEGMAQSKADVGEVLTAGKTAEAATLRSEMDRKIAEQKMIVDNVEYVDLADPSKGTQPKEYKKGERKAALNKINEYKQAKFGLSSEADAPAVLGIGAGGTVPGGTSSGACRDYSEHTSADSKTCFTGYIYIFRAH